MSRRAYLHVGLVVVGGVAAATAGWLVAGWWGVAGGYPAGQIGTLALLARVQR